MPRCDANSAQAPGSAGRLGRGRRGREHGHRRPVLESTANQQGSMDEPLGGAAGCGGPAGCAVDEEEVQVGEME